MGVNQMSNRLNKRLYRSSDSRMIAGVAGGIADYLGIDPTIVRVAWVVGTLVLAPTIPLSILVYVALAIIIPQEPNGG
jgi:phage shock protein C